MAAATCDNGHRTQRAVRKPGDPRRGLYTEHLDPWLESAVDWQRIGPPPRRTDQPQSIMRPAPGVECGIAGTRPVSA